MDFKTELQALVNKYPGIIKKVRVEFVNEMEVEPNGVQFVQPKTYTPVEKLTIPAGTFQMTETVYTEMPTSPTQQAIKKTLDVLTKPVL
jgi:hypothetical protein